MTCKLNRRGAPSKHLTRRASALVATVLLVSTGGDLARAQEPLSISTIDQVSPGWVEVTKGSESTAPLILDVDVLMPPDRPKNVTAWLMLSATIAHEDGITLDIVGAERSPWVPIDAADDVHPMTFRWDPVVLSDVVVDQPQVVRIALSAHLGIGVDAPPKEVYHSGPTEFKGEVRPAVALATIEPAAGATIQVEDPASPAFGMSLEIGPGAIDAAMPTNVAIEVLGAHTPGDEFRHFFGPSVAIEVQGAGQQFLNPVYLALPVQADLATLKTNEPRIVGYDHTLKRWLDDTKSEIVGEGLVGGWIPSAGERSTASGATSMEVDLRGVQVRGRATCNGADSEVSCPENWYSTLAARAFVQLANSPDIQTGQDSLCSVRFVDEDGHSLTLNTNGTTSTSCAKAAVPDVPRLAGSIQFDTRDADDITCGDSMGVETDFDTEGDGIADGTEYQFVVTGAPRHGWSEILAYAGYDNAPDYAGYYEGTSVLAASGCSQQAVEFIDDWLRCGAPGQEAPFDCESTDVDRMGYPLFKCLLVQIVPEPELSAATAAFDGDGNITSHAMTATFPVGVEAPADSVPAFEQEWETWALSIAADQGPEVDCAVAFDGDSRLGPINATAVNVDNNDNGVDEPTVLSLETAQGTSAKLGANADSAWLGFKGKGENDGIFACQPLALDQDGDGYPAPRGDKFGCPDSPDGAGADCTSIYDCDDLDPAINPGTLWYRDGDSDGFGDPYTTLTQCEQPTGYVRNSDDCDDATDTRHPGATETCDHIDEDCDDKADEGAQLTLYVDNDGDGFGLTHTQYLGCPQGGGAPSGGDCDDDDPDLHPTNPEACDGFDQDCDSLVDEGLTECNICYADRDGDGFGGEVTDCEDPAAVETAGDCDDSEASINPGAGASDYAAINPETGEPVDTNCDGEGHPLLGEGTLVDVDHDGVTDAILVDASLSGAHIQGVINTLATSWQAASGASYPGHLIDTVAFAPGTYRVNLEVVGASIALVGLGQPAEIILDAGGEDCSFLGDTLCSAVAAHGGAHLALERLTLSSGWGTPIHRLGGSGEASPTRYGGGLLIYNAHLDARQLIIRGSQAHYGSGVAILHSRGESNLLTGLLLEDNVNVDAVEGETALVTGAVYALNADMRLLGSSLVGNRTEDDPTDGVSYGAAIGLANASAHLAHNHIESNVGYAFSGLAIGTASADDAVYAHHNSFVGNQAHALGAAIGSLRVMDLDESGAHLPASDVISHNLFAFNDATSGAVLLMGEAPAFTNNVLTQNDAATTAGLVLSLTTPAVLGNNVFDRNQSLLSSTEAIIYPADLALLHQPEGEQALREAEGERWVDQGLLTTRSAPMDEAQPPPPLAWAHSSIFSPVDDLHTAISCDPALGLDGGLLYGATAEGGSCGGATTALTEVGHPGPYVDYSYPRAWYDNDLRLAHGWADTGIGDPTLNDADGTPNDPGAWGGPWAHPLVGRLTSYCSGEATPFAGALTTATANGAGVLDRHDAMGPAGEAVDLWLVDLTGPQASGDALIQIAAGDQPRSASLLRIDRGISEALDASVGCESTPDHMISVPPGSQGTLGFLYAGEVALVVVEGAPGPYTIGLTAP